MHVEIETRGEVNIVRPDLDAIDASNAKELKRHLGELAPRHPRMVLDLEQVGFLDNSGLGAILSVLRKVTAAGGDLKLCNVTPPVRALLEMVRLHRIVEIFEGLDDAVRSWDQ